MTPTATGETPKLRLVPFNAAWISHDKIDAHAIYRRPVFVEDPYGELIRAYDAAGLPRWDITTPLPIKMHNKLTAKGYEYVTLADRNSLIMCGRNNTIDGRWQDYDQHRTGGPWNYKLYAMGVESDHTREASELEADVREFGSAAVRAIRRRTWPDFELPENLRNILPGQLASVPDAQPKAQQKAGKAPAEATQ